MKSRQDLLNEARQHITEMTAQEVHEYVQQGNKPVLLDVRGLDEWEIGHAEHAVHIARGHLEQRAEAALPDKSREVIIYCGSGVRSLLAGVALKELGYENVISMSGGYQDWEDGGYPAVHLPVAEDDVRSGTPELLKAEIAHLEEQLRKKRGVLSEIEEE